MPWRIVDFDRLLQGDLHYPESYSAEVHRLRALRPGDRVEFRCLLPEDRKRHGVKGTVVELDIPKGWAVVNLDNGEKWRMRQRRKAVQTRRSTIGASGT